MTWPRKVKIRPRERRRMPLLVALLGDGRIELIRGRFDSFLLGLDEVDGLVDIDIVAVDRPHGAPLSGRRCPWAPRSESSRGRVRGQARTARVPPGWRRRRCFARCRSRAKAVS